MYINKIIQTSADAGKIVLENGGETYRVEDTMQKICEAYGITSSNSFVTPTGIMLSATDEQGHAFALIRRIKNRTTNLEKLARVNYLARSIKSNHLSIDEFDDKLKQINLTPHYSELTHLICGSFSAASCTIIFGGNYFDASISMIAGGAIKAMSIFLTRFNFNNFFINLIGGAIASTIALFAVKYGFAIHTDKIIIGAVMLLVPGIAITNAIRDTISGDLIAGSARAVEAFFIAVAIAVGVGFILKLWFIYFGIKVL